MGNQLSYAISHWNQLPKCLSNLSSKYRIVVTNYPNNDERIVGMGVSVIHKEFGTLYSKLIDATGTIIDNKYITASYPQVLEDLKAFGFNIIYTPHKHLDGEQLQKLMSIRDLGYDKLRIIAVKNTNSLDKVQYRVVTFKSTFLPYWLNNNYVTNLNEYFKAVDKMYCFPVCDFRGSKDHEMWDWIEDCVLNIDDVLDENSHN